MAALMTPVPGSLLRDHCSPGWPRTHCNLPASFLSAQCRDYRCVAPHGTPVLSLNKHFPVFSQPLHKAPCCAQRGELKDLP